LLEAIGTEVLVCYKSLLCQEVRPYGARGACARLFVESIPPGAWLWFAINRCCAKRSVPMALYGIRKQYEIIKQSFCLAAVNDDLGHFDAFPQCEIVVRHIKANS